MKKGKVISMPTSVEAQIRTRARNLPLGKCYVTNAWDTVGVANVIVTRKHANGNITYGFFYVDLLLLGVKDCYYNFNESPDEFKERLEDAFELFEECDYALAHNIIYESIAFAEENGFQPMKNFKIAKYILEEDTDDIHHMDIPVGQDGVPVVYITHEEDMQHEIAVLKKTVGDGNFIVFHEDEDGYIGDDDDDDDDNRFSFDNYLNTIDKITEMGVEKYFLQYGDHVTPTQILALTDLLYVMKFGDSDDENLYQLIIDDERYDPDLLMLPEIEKYNDSIQSIVDQVEENPDTALAEMEALAMAHPDDVYLGITHIMLLYDLGTEDELECKILYWYDREPNNHSMRLCYAGWLTEQERFDELFELFGNLPGLDAITKENVPFTEVMVCDFCACYVLAWLSKDDIAKADPYYQLLLQIDNVTKSVSNAFFAMTAKKREAIMGEIT